MKEINVCPIACYKEKSNKKFRPRFAGLPQYFIGLLESVKGSDLVSKIWYLFDKIVFLIHSQCENVNVSVKIVTSPELKNC